MAAPTTVTGTLTVAQILGMQATPISVVAPAGASLFYYVLNFGLNLIYGNDNPMAAGGYSYLSYDALGQVIATPAGIGPNLMWATSNFYGNCPGQPLLMSSAMLENQGLYISNTNVPFTCAAGSVSTVNYYITYMTLAIA